MGACSMNPKKLFTGILFTIAVSLVLFQCADYGTENVFDPTFEGNYKLEVIAKDTSVIYTVFTPYVFDYETGEGSYDDIIIAESSLDIVDENLFKISSVGTTMRLYFKQAFKGNILFNAVRPNGIVDTAKLSVEVINPYIIDGSDTADVDNEFCYNIIYDMSTIEIDTSIDADDVGEIKDEEVFTPQTKSVVWFIDSTMFEDTVEFDSAFCTLFEEKGEYKLSALLVDSNNNSITLDTFTVIVPGKKPVLNLTSENDWVFIGDEIAPAISISNADEGEATLFFIHGESEFETTVTLEEDSSDVSWNPGITIDSEGKDSIIAYVTHENGLTSDSVLFVFTVIALPPDVEFTSEESSLTIAVNDSFALEVTDNAYEYVWQWVAAEKKDTTTSSVLKGLFDVDYPYTDTLIVTGLDSLGNAGTSDSIILTSSAFFYGIDFDTKAPWMSIGKDASWTAAVTALNDSAEIGDITIHWMVVTHEDDTLADTALALDSEFLFSASNTDSVIVSAIVSDAQGRMSDVISESYRVSEPPVVTFSADEHELELAVNDTLHITVTNNAYNYIWTLVGGDKIDTSDSEQYSAVVFNDHPQSDTLLVQGMDSLGNVGPADTLFLSSVEFFYTVSFDPKAEFICIDKDAFWGVAVETFNEEPLASDVSVHWTAVSGLGETLADTTLPVSKHFALKANEILSIAVSAAVSDESGRSANTIKANYRVIEPPTVTFSAENDTIYTVVNDSTSIDVTGEAYRYVWERVSSEDIDTTEEPAYKDIIITDHPQVETVVVYGVDSLGNAGPADTLFVASDGFEYAITIDNSPQKLFVNRNGQWTVSVQNMSDPEDNTPITVYWKILDTDNNELDTATGTSDEPFSYTPAASLVIPEDSMIIRVEAQIVDARVKNGGTAISTDTVFLGKPIVKFDEATLDDSLASGYEVSLAVSGTDPQGDKIASYGFKVTGNSEAIDSLSDQNTLSFTPIDEGEYTFTLWVIDIDSVVSDSIVFTKKVWLPKLEMDLPDDLPDTIDTIDQVNISLSGEYPYDGGSIDSFYIEVILEEEVLDTIETTDKSYSISFKEAGEYTLKLFSKTGTGVVSDPVEHIITVVKSVPVVDSVSISKETIYAGDEINLSVSVSLGSLTESGIKNYYWDFDSDTSEEWDSVKQVDTIDYVFNEVRENITCWVVVEDELGRRSEVKTITFDVLDGTPEIINVEINNNSVDIYTYIPIELKLEGTDPNENELIWYIARNEDDTIIIKTHQEDTTISLDSVENPVENYPIEVWLVDSRGNKSSTSKNVGLDIISGIPLIDNSELSTLNTFVDDTVKVTITAHDVNGGEIAGWKIKAKRPDDSDSILFDKESYADGFPITFSSGQSGDWIIYVSVIDENDSLESAQDSVGLINVDLGLPVLDVPDTIFAKYLFENFWSQKAIFSIEASDNDSIVRRFIDFTDTNFYEDSLGRNTPGLCTLSNVTDTIDITDYFDVSYYEYYPDDVHFWEVQPSPQQVMVFCEDISGNVDSNVVVFYPDAVPPYYWEDNFIAEVNIEKVENNRIKVIFPDFLDAIAGNRTEFRLKVRQLDEYGQGNVSDSVQTPGWVTPANFDVINDGPYGSFFAYTFSRGFICPWLVVSDVEIVIECRDQLHEPSHAIYEKEYDCQ